MQSPGSTRDGASNEGLPPQESTKLADWAHDRGARGQVEVDLASEAPEEEEGKVAPSGPLTANLPPLKRPQPEDALEQAGTFVRLACWLALLFAGYGFQRGLCAGGLPYDCQAKDAAGIYSGLTALAFAGGALGWLVGVTCPARFSWLAAPRRGYIWLVYAATLPSYSAISNIPALHSSLSSRGVNASPAMIATLVLAGLAVLAAVVWHLWLAAVAEGGSNSGISTKASKFSTRASTAELLEAEEAGAAAAPAAPAPDTPQSWSISCWGGGGPGCRRVGSDSSIGRMGGGQKADSRRRSAGRRRRRRQVQWRRLGLYLLPRVAVLAYFGAWMAALPASGAFDLHLHHYALGWALASLAAFNHPVSGLVLGLGTAVFVQGVGAYGLDPFFKSATSKGGCLPVASNSTGQMVCAFWAADPFALKFCSDTPHIPWFDCTVPWPWPGTALQASNSKQATRAAINGSNASGSSGTAQHRAGLSPSSQAAQGAAPAPLPLFPAGEPML